MKSQYCKFKGENMNSNPKLRDGNIPDGVENWTVEYKMINPKDSMPVFLKMKSTLKNSSNEPIKIVTYKDVRHEYNEFALKTISLDVNNGKATRMIEIFDKDNIDIIIGKCITSYDINHACNSTIVNKYTIPNRSLKEFDYDYDENINVINVNYQYTSITEGTIILKNLDTSLSIHYTYDVNGLIEEARYDCSDNSRTLIELIKYYYDVTLLPLQEVRYMADSNHELKVCKVKNYINLIN